MTTENKKPWQDSTWITGMALIALSTFIFLFPDFLKIKDQFFGFFTVNYIIAIFYFFLLVSVDVIRTIKAKRRDSPECIAIYLILCLISAFSLNREIPIFQQSTLWLQVDIVVMCLSLIGLSFRKYLPEWYSYLLYFLLGPSLLICIYFTVFLAPFYPFAFVGFFVFGISLHVYIPLLFCIFIISILLGAYKLNKKFLLSFAAGAAWPLVILTYFMIKWNVVSQQITYTYNSSITDTENTLPNWVKVSQKLGDDWVTERVIKGDLVYVTYNRSGDFFNAPRLRSFEEVKQHDPLVVIASFFSIPELNYEEQVKIAESAFKGRHLAEERLWGGKYLKTSNVITDVMIYPDLRISYTEKILNITNTSLPDTWDGRQQEAIYTFKLPEGTAVTSLSLWINGKEEKGILTTKAKADSAYKTIVGVLRRDPSVVHWREGNTVSVRVFPCTPQEARRFKIGFTSPLTVSEGKLTYQNITFEGPSANDATETILIRLDKPTPDLELPGSFTSLNDKKFQHEGNYKEDWEIAMPNNPVADKSFSFDNNTYKIKEYKKTFETFTPDAVYLDVNASWTEDEYNKVLEVLKDKEVYVFQNKMEKVTNDNRKQLFDYYSGLNFSMFPFYKIKAENPLVVSKSSEDSPNLSDISESEFASELTHYLEKKEVCRLFNIGKRLSPYIKTLKEFRVFGYDHGSIQELEQAIISKKFPFSQEDNNTITVHNACINITKEEGTSANTAPDHLMRLFAYNHLLKDINSKYFAKQYTTDSTNEEARQAYIVSPVSSLIVLETAADYERFNIHEDANSLSNASMKSSGSVPEPHEWALIIIALCVITYLLLKNRLHVHAA